LQALTPTPAPPPLVPQRYETKGFLPEEYDGFIQNYLYPSFSPQMLAFLASSSLYGLWKTGALPGQKQL